MGWNFTSAYAVSLVPVYHVFTALNNEAPATSYATLDTRNAHPVLDFDASVDEHAVFRGVLSPAYGGDGLVVKIIWAATSATSGTCRWGAQFERIAAGGLDIDAGSFDTAQTAAGTANGTSGMTTETTIAFSSGQIDGLLAGEMFRLRVYRDGDGTSGTDDMTGDAELLAVVVTET